LGKLVPEKRLTKLHIQHYKSLLTSVYDHAGCERLSSVYCRVWFEFPVCNLLMFIWKTYAWDRRAIQKICVLLIGQTRWFQALYL